MNKKAKIIAATMTAVILISVFVAMAEAGGCETGNPLLDIEYPVNGTITTNDFVDVSGFAGGLGGTYIDNVTVNGRIVPGTWIWCAAVGLSEGQNTITVTATDCIGQQTTKTISVTYKPLEKSIRTFDPQWFETVEQKFLGATEATNPNEGDVVVMTAMTRDGKFWNIGSSSSISIPEEIRNLPGPDKTIVWVPAEIPAEVYKDASVGTMVRITTMMMSESTAKKILKTQFNSEKRLRNMGAMKVKEDVCVGISRNLEPTPTTTPCIDIIGDTFNVETGATTAEIPVRIENGVGYYFAIFGKTEKPWDKNQLWLLSCIIKITSDNEDPVVPIGYGSCDETRDGEGAEEITIYGGLFSEEDLPWVRETNHYSEDKVMSALITMDNATINRPCDCCCRIDI